MVVCAHVLVLLLGECGMRRVRNRPPTKETEHKHHCGKDPSLLVSSSPSPVHVRTRARARGFSMFCFFISQPHFTDLSLSLSPRLPSPQLACWLAIPLASFFLSCFSFFFCDESARSRFRKQTPTWLTPRHAHAHTSLVFFVCFAPFLYLFFFFHTETPKKKITRKNKKRNEKEQHVSRTQCFEPRGGKKQRGEMNDGSVRSLPCPVPDPPPSVLRCLSAGRTTQKQKGGKRRCMVTELEK